MKMTEKEPMFEYLESICEFVPVRFWWVGLDKIVLGCNKIGWEAIGAANKSDFVGKNALDGFQDKEIAKTLEEWIDEVINTKTIIQKEYSLVNLQTRKNICFSGTYAPLYDANGKLIGLVGASVDITAEKEAEQLRLEAESNKVQMLQLQNEAEVNKAQLLQAENEAHKKVIEEQETFRTVVKNMLHDINSPISSLNTIVADQSSNMPENARVTLRQAAERIGDITHNLMFRYENQDAENEKKVLLVSDALLEVMREKRYEYHDSHVKIETIVDKASANFAFTKTVSGDFKRMISNLINNAVEAVKHKADGKVILELASTPKHVVIAIEDNGNGMPKHIQEKFKNGIAVTEGKEGRHSGVGLTQIRATILASGGTFDIYVTDKVKTRIVIKFPLIPTPAYIAAEIKLTKDDLIIVLDDDESVHSAWDTRFDALVLQFPTLKIKHFFQGKDAIQFINKLSAEQKEDTILLTDYELLGQDMNGLDVVRETNMSRAILVTSYASKPEIQELVVKAGIRTLPKDLASAVPITVDKKIPKWSSKADIVWIEDQKYFVDNLVSQYYTHLVVDVYYDPVNFLQDLHQYPLETRIILDTYYEDQNGKTYSLTGYDIAERLNEAGYTKLILISGEAVDQNNIPEYLKVILKTDTDDLKTLDKS